MRDCYPKTAYLNYIAGDWKPEQEALKRDGQIISYKVVQTEAHGSTDFNLMLMTEYKDLLTRKIWKKPMLYCKRSSATTKSSDNEGYRQHSEIRGVLAERLGREIVLEPNR